MASIQDRAIEYVYTAASYDTSSAAPSTLPPSTHTSVVIIQPTLTITESSSSSSPSSTSPVSSALTSALTSPPVSSRISSLSEDATSIPFSISTAIASTIPSPSPPLGGSTSIPFPRSVTLPSASTSPSTKMPPPAMPSDPNMKIMLVPPSGGWASWTPAQRNGVIAVCVLAFITLTAIIVCALWIQRKRKESMQPLHHGADRQVKATFGNRLGFGRVREVDRGGQRIGRSGESLDVRKVEGGSLRARSANRGVQEGKGKGREDGSPGGYEMSGALRSSGEKSVDDEGHGWIRVLGRSRRS
ncbi:hypothetical protein ACLMJK_004863 [Lecanora helva]